MGVTKLDITNRTLFADGQEFGDVGQYEFLEGTVHFAVDPKAEQNAPITDLGLAPRDSNGNVRFSSHVALLRPVDAEKANRRVLFDVVNRGRKTVLGAFNHTERPADPATPLKPGNGFLMRHGFTVAFCGWQADVPEIPGLMGMQAPQAVGPDGQPLRGRIFNQFQVNEPTQILLLSHNNHVPHTPAEIDDQSATLTVRDLPGSAPTELNRADWSFIRVEDQEVEPDPNHIFLPSGFEPGRIYQLAYETVGATVIGLGLVAVRDFNSFLKYGSAEDGNPLAGYIDYAYVFGSSQSGRFLREQLYLGLNEDEDKRTALDGFIPHIAGGYRGEFNVRFGQPSQDIVFINPGGFPYSDYEQTDPITGKTDGLLNTLDRSNQPVPKIMFTNTSGEYWRGDAALIHTDLDPIADAAESENVRRYHFASCQHGPGVFPPLDFRPSDGIRGQLPLNSVDYTPLLRAALVNLDAWVTNGVEPPLSRHPSLSAGTAVESRTLADKFSKLPGFAFPPRLPQAISLDHGDQKDQGLLTILPSIQLGEYPALVADIDDSYNDRGGIRLPDVEAPVASYSGWNLRHPSIGNPDLYIGITGGLDGWTLALPATAADREASGDPRLSIGERYASKEDYLAHVNQAANALAGEGYLLEEDIESIVEQAGQKYDYFTKD